MKIKHLRAAFLLLGLVYFVSGCASGPTVRQREAFPTYNIHGAVYLPLVTLCEARGIDWRYDTFTRAIALNKDAHRVTLKVGDTLVVIDGSPMHLAHPVELYKGTVAVPYKFKEQVMDGVLRGYQASPSASLALSRIKKIAVDAGHGGNDPGAIGRSGLREKDVNLDLAKRLTTLLKARGVEVVMTRSTDKYIPLSTRVDIANNARVNLFVSVHSNANRVRSLNGFEVYYVSPTVGDSARALTSAKNSIPWVLSPSCVVGNSLDLRAILWDMYYTHNRAESIELSRSLCWSVDKNLDAKLLGIKAARFEVLRGIRMPGVLVETGFLSNAAEELKLKNSFYRQKLAESIAQGIEEYAKSVPSTEVAKR